MESGQFYQRVKLVVGVSIIFAEELHIGLILIAFFILIYSRLVTSSCSVSTVHLILSVFLGQMKFKILLVQHVLMHVAF